MKKYLYLPVFLISCAISAHAQCTTHVMVLNLGQVQSCIAGAKVSAGQILALNGSDQVVPITAGVANRTFGVAVQSAPSGFTVGVATAGSVDVLVDGSCTIGQAIVISPTTNGLGHCESLIGTSPQSIGTASSASSGASYVSAQISPLSSGSGTSSGSRSPGGSTYQLQLYDVGGVFGGTPCANLSPAGTPIDFDCDTHFKGRDPYLDASRYGARSVNANVAPQVAGITANCTGGSNKVSLRSASTFQNGDGVLLFDCGNPQSMGTPTISSVTPSVSRVMTGVGDDVSGPPGSTTWGPYQVFWCDLAGGCTAPSPGVSTTTGQASLGAQSVAISSETRFLQTTTVTTSSPHGLPVGCANPFCPMVLTSGTWDGTFQGQWHVASVPDTNHFTYVAGLLTTNGASTISTGGTTTWWNANHIAFTAPRGGYQAFICKSGTLIGSALPLNPTNPEMLDGSLWFDDYGAAMHTGFTAYPPYLSASCPSSATSDPLSTTIVSGGGTTTLTLATAAGTNQTGTTILYDATPLIKAAVLAAGGAAVYLPPNVEMVLNSNLDLSTTAAALTGGNNLVMRGTMLLGGINKWDGNAFPYVGSQGSFQYQSNIQVYCEMSPSLFLVNNGSNYIAHIQFNPESNGMVQILADGGGGAPHGTFQNLYFGSPGNDFLNVDVWLRGASDNSSSGGGHFENVNVHGNQGNYGKTDTPAFYADNGYIEANYLWLNGRGVLQRSGPSGGNGLDIKHAYIQGGFESVFTVTGLEDGLGNEDNVSINAVEMDTTSANLLNYIQSGGSTLVVASVSNMGSGPDSGYTLWGGQPFVGAYGSISGQNTGAIAGTNYTDNAVSVNGIGAFMYPIMNSTAPTTTVSSGGSVPVGNYYYYVTVTDANGNESTASPASAVTSVTAGNQTVTIPPPTSPGAVSWTPYRGPVGQGNVKLVIPGCTSLPFGAPFVDTYSYSCNSSSPTISRAAADSLSGAGLVGTKLILTNSGFKGVFSPNTLTANRNWSMPDIAGIASLVVGYDAQIARTSAQTAKTLYTVRASNTLFRADASVACDSSSSAATVLVTILYTDVSGTAQSLATGTANCTTLGSGSVANEVISFMAEEGTVIQYSTTVANRPTYDVRVALTQLGVN